MANPIVDIIIRATDKASGVLRGVAGETGKLDDANKRIVGSYTELNSMLSLAQTGLSMARDIYRETVGAAMEYAQQVEDVARATGMSTEESSRWIQIAQDVRLEFGEMKTAMRFALQQGIDPSIDGMKRLSEQYLAIQDPVARSQFLIENFGRSGLNMGRLLERGAEGIEKLNQGVNEGLILTPQAVQASEDYRMSLDSMSDSIEAVKIALGNKLIPTLDYYVTIATTLMNITDLSADSFETLGEKVFKARPDIRLMYETIMNVNEMSKEGASNIDMLSYSFGQLGKTVVSAVLPGVFEANLTWEEFTGNLENADTAVEDITPSIYSLAEAGSYAASEQDRFNQRLAAYQQELQLAKQANMELIPAIDAVTAAEERFGKSLGQNVSAELDKFMSEDSQRYEEALKAIDEAMGTNLSSQDELGDGVNALAKDFASGKIDIEEFKNRLGELKDQFQPFDDAVIESKKKVKELYDQWGELANLPNKYDIWVNVHWQEFNRPSGVGYGPGGPGGNRQHGGPVRGGRPYMVGEAGPEVFVPVTSGVVVPNTGNVLDQIGQSIREALTSGIAHAGRY